MNLCEARLVAREKENRILSRQKAQSSLAYARYYPAPSTSAGLVEELLAFRIGASPRDYLVVRPRRRTFPLAADLYDRDWVYATIKIAAGGFVGQFAAMLRADEFVRFRHQLRRLEQSAGEKAAFDATVGGLRIDVTAKSDGRFHAKGCAVDQRGIGNRLTFAIDFDGSELPRVLSGLDSICEAFPVFGKAPALR